MDISAYQHMNIRMSTRGKRPLRNLTPNDKVRAIQRIHNGETKASVSRDIGVPESTLRGWCKNEQKLRFMCRQLGSDSLGLGGLDTPPEKRAKFELQLLPPKFATMPSYEDLGFASFPVPPMDYASHNEALLEKFALVDFLKRSGLHKESIQYPLPDVRSANPTDPVSAVAGYSTNNMVHQLNLLALFNSKLSPKVDHPNITEANPKSDEAVILAQPQMEVAEQSKKYNCPLLSVKNWAKDPAKQSPSPTESQFINDNNNNDIDGTIPSSSDVEPAQSTQISAEATTPSSQPTFGPTRLGQAPLLSTPPAIDADSGQGGALLDWCKMFSASLNFFAFAAAAASIQPGNGPAAVTPGLPITNASEDTHNFGNDLLKRLSPLVSHSESSEESYYDSEPEDLSVRSCASKVSSSINSRSQSPDKNSTSSTSVHSDGEQ